MKVTHKVLVIAAAFAIAYVGHFPVQAVAQRPMIQNKTALPEVEVISGMRADDATEATGIPRPDLAIKEMCMADNPGAATGSVGVLLANIGNADAGTFLLGFQYLDSEGGGRFAVDKIDGLKAGEELWIMESHICCGWAPRSLVYAASGFLAIADPKYYKTSPIPGLSGEVKSVIPESNEGNNSMSAKKSELRPCGMLDKKVEPVLPRKLEPARPRKP